MTPKPRVKLYPDVPAAGSIVEVKTLINHVMETGQRRAADGTAVKRNIIHAFTASFEGEEVFRAELHSGISSNPFLGFFMRVPAAGKLALVWHDDEDQTVTETIDVKVS